MWQKYLAQSLSAATLLETIPEFRCGRREFRSDEEKKIFGDVVQRFPDIELICRICDGLRQRINLFSMSLLDILRVEADPRLPYG